MLIKDQNQSILEKMFNKRKLKTIHLGIRNIFVLTGIIYLSFSLISCGLFGTRSPQSPNTTRSTYVPPTTPDIVLTNFEYSISEKNSNNYIKNLYSVTYQYVPDSKSQALYGTLFSTWNINSEKLYLDNLIANSDQNSSSSLFLSNTTTQITSDSAITTSDYIIVFQHNKSNIPKSAVGNLKLTLKPDENSYYYITRWEDFRKNDTDFTWSQMKASFSN